VSVTVAVRVVDICALIGVLPVVLLMWAQARKGRARWQRQASDMAVLATFGLFAYLIVYAVTYQPVAAGR
jgi:hypothetical protein